MFILLNLALNIGCVAKKKFINLGHSARLSENDIRIMRGEADSGNWRSASKLYKHFAYGEQRPDLAAPYQWGIDERNRRRCEASPVNR